MDHSENRNKTLRRLVSRLYGWWKRSPEKPSLSGAERQVVALAAAVLGNDDAATVARRTTARLHGVRSDDLDRIGLGLPPRSRRLRRLVRATGIIVQYRGWLDIDDGASIARLSVDRGTLLEISAIIGVPLRMDPHATSVFSSTSTRGRRRGRGGSGRVRLPDSAAVCYIPRLPVVGTRHEPWATAHRN